MRVVFPQPGEPVKKIAGILETMILLNVGKRWNDHIFFETTSFLFFDLDGHGQTSGCFWMTSSSKTKSIHPRLRLRSTKFETCHVPTDTSNENARYDFSGIAFTFEFFWIFFRSFLCLSDKKVAGDSCFDCDSWHSILL